MNQNLQYRFTDETEIINILIESDQYDHAAIKARLYNYFNNSLQDELFCIDGVDNSKYSCSCCNEKIFNQDDQDSKLTDAFYIRNHGSGTYLIVCEWCQIGFDVFNEHIKAKKCGVCETKIYQSDKNENLYDGFTCKDTNMFVCTDCKSKYYQLKNKGEYGMEHAGKYQEVPVPVVRLLPTATDQIPPVEESYSNKLKRIFKAINPNYPELIDKAEWIKPENIKVYPYFYDTNFHVDSDNPLVCDECGKKLLGNGSYDSAYFVHDKPYSIKIYCSIRHCYKGKIIPYDYHHQHYGYLNKIKLNDESFIASKSKIPTPHMLVFSMLGDSDKYMLNDYVPNGIGNIQILKKLNIFNSQGGGTSLFNGWYQYNNATVKWHPNAINFVKEKPKINLTPGQVLKALNEILAKSPVQKRIVDPVIVVKQASYITPDMVVPANPSAEQIVDTNNKPSADDFIVNRKNTTGLIDNESKFISDNKLTLEEFINKHKSFYLDYDEKLVVRWLSARYAWMKEKRPEWSKALWPYILQAKKEMEQSKKASNSPIPNKKASAKKKDQKSTKQKINYFTGLHGCSCHPFATYSELSKANKQKFSVGDQVHHRCTYKVGFVIGINDQDSSFYSVKFGKNPRDINSVHASNLTLLKSVNSPLNNNFKLKKSDNNTKSKGLSALLDNKINGLDKLLDHPSKNNNETRLSKVKPKTANNVDTKKKVNRDDLIKFRCTKDTKDLVNKMAGVLDISVADLIHLALKEFAACPDTDENYKKIKAVITLPQAESIQ